MLWVTTPIPQVKAIPAIKRSTRRRVLYGRLQLLAGQSSPGNQEVHLPNELSPLTQLRIQCGCGIKSSISERKNLTSLTELLKGLQLTVRVDGPISSDDS